ncbi:MAG: hypothetical protein ACFB0B_21170 [Thermonemataceae bacterium]
MKKMNQILWAMFLGSALVFTGCDDDDDPEPENEPELITTINVTFTNTDDADDEVTFTASDEDGDGMGITYENGTLTRGATYDIEIEVLNETETPVEDVTEEIEEEDDEHQIYFGFPTTLFEDFSYENTDGNGDPLGTEAQVTVVEEATQGSFIVIIQHEPNKEANSDTTPWVYSDEIGGETDANVTFTVSVQDAEEPVTVVRQ